MKFPSGFWKLAFWILCLLASQPRSHAAGNVLYEQRIRSRPVDLTVPVHCDGQTIPMILDTGLSFRALDPSMQSHLTEYIGEETMNATDGQLAVHLWKSPAMTIGKWKLPPSHTFTLDCAPFRRVLGTDVRGLLGLDCFQHAALELNFDRGKLRFLRQYQPPASVTPFLAGESPRGWKFVPMGTDDLGTPTVRIEMDGIVVNPEIDTGSNSYLCLQTATFDQLVATGAIERTPEADGIEVTATGTSKSREGVFTRGNILGIDLKGAAVSDGRNADLLGMSFLTQFNLVYDPIIQRLYFERRQHAEPVLNAVRMIGAVFVYPEGHCQVEETLPGPAENAGLRKGDGIRKLGPLRGKELNFNSIYDLCETCAGRTIEVQYTRSGQPHALKTRLKVGAKRFLYPVQP